MSFIHKKFAQVLNKYQYNFHPGDIIVGTIFSKEKTGYLVDIGNNTAGYLPEEEISLTNKQRYIENLILHDTQEFFILAYNFESKQLVLSIRRLAYMRSWERLKQIKSEDIAIQAYIKGINRGGALVEIENIQGFIPNSHLLCNESKKDLLYKYRSCKLLVANEQNNKLICSIRCATIAQIMHTIKIGTTIDARVIEVTEFGVFFNIYNIPALLHKSELKDKELEDLEYIFEKQSQWKIQIIHLDSKQGRISVSLAN
uniref:Ribosomal protein S1 n=1 Tax=Liagora brachyclada TaxID=1884665 RepID=A0A1G4P097_9FLOR|nr:Ribosomal protein S1 [Liagora brachyclada]SCW24297.1 Ribosomal protein S1 [Liagora brachyclada]